jgi:hypothetical protein
MYEHADKLPRYAAPILFQIVVLWILLVHALFEMPPEVFNGV